MTRGRCRPAPSGGDRRDRATPPAAHGLLARVWTRVRGSARVVRRGRRAVWVPIRRRLAREWRRGLVAANAVSKSPSRSRRAAIEQSRPALLAFTGLVTDPQHRARALLLESDPFGGEGLVHLTPASGLPDDGRRDLERDPLRAALPDRSSKSRAGPDGCRSRCSRGRERSRSPSGRATNSALPSALPALVALDAGDRAVGDLEVEAVVHGDELLRRRGARG